MNHNKNKLCTLAAILLLTKTTTAQTTTSKTSASLWDGMAVAGYVDKGAFLNFGGPAVKWTHKPFCISLGMLPSLRIKEDKVAPNVSKNATITPSLGFGLSASYKHLALQVPLYYNAKTASADGKWNVGVGLGYKF
ncbi:hypothetical protein [Niabella drilacis]|uniref:Outer membrane insertion C-terminal signal n=1 Tax=Niabella drilacis (strain DSM 25811 / CCM 8410 / CCUG 62505 / LMG 26954 / E90) TaxID=1285928 RepID=A0A1G6SD48_NIADE|nr:hypothetical protein [Niabella drilacis]SDD14830.1 outer membrane insertion C-terminal signal [Niabella drilacis]